MIAQYEVESGDSVAHRRKLCQAKGWIIVAITLSLIFTFSAVSMGIPVALIWAANVQSSQG